MDRPKEETRPSSPRKGLFAAGFIHCPQSARHALPPLPVFANRAINYGLTPRYAMWGLYFKIIYFY